VLAELVAAMGRAPVRVLARVPGLARVRVLARVPGPDSATAWSAPDYRCRTRRRTPESESLGRHTERAIYAA